VLPEESDMDSGEGGVNQDWKRYFDLIFGKLMSTKKIDSFELKYKMSAEEESDVLKYYTKFEGNLVKCLEFVMLSHERDVERWMEDYIQPAIDEGKVETFPSALKNSRAKIQKKLAKEQQQEEEEELDEDETETEESDQEPVKAKSTTKKTTAKKAKPTQTKNKNKTSKNKKSSSAGPSDDLIAAIRNKKRGGGGNPFSALGARYGVDMSNDDPLDDAAFAKIQSKFKK
jgi:hypothetical protein